MSPTSLQATFMGSHPSHEPPVPLRVTARHRRQSLTLQVEGEVDVLTAPNLREALERAVDERPQLLVVDLSAVGFLGCAGLSVLVAAHQRAGWRTCLRMVATEQVTVRPLRLTGLDEYLAVYGSVHDALTDPVSTNRTGH